MNHFFRALNATIAANPIILVAAAGVIVSAALVILVATF